jgi:diadenosine tetraphosphate (Ap4A) HIT family hydrolase
MNEFERFKIKEYKFWDINIHENQGYLGRTVVWCRRDNAQDLTEATPEEYAELLVVIKDLKKALETLFQPDWFNYALLGNVSPHLHCHVIPRYKGPREFGGMTFTDPLWGFNYQTDPKFVTPPELLAQVQSKIKETLG